MSKPTIEEFEDALDGVWYAVRAWTDAQRDREASGEAELLGDARRAHAECIAMFRRALEPQP